MTTPTQSTAVLVDLHASSSSTFACNQTLITQLIKDTFIDMLNNHPACDDVVHLYLLVSASSHDGNKDLEQLTASHEDTTHVTLVQAADRIEGFYRAKQQLDNLDITKVYLLCNAEHQDLWTEVCRWLFTPVYGWKVIETAMLSSCPSTDCNTISDPGNDADERQCTPNVPRNDTERIHGIIETPSRISCHSEQLQDNTPRTASESARVASTDSVRAEIEQYLQTLPCMLGLPEAFRSGVLPGRRDGFVHGYSTRRGGVTDLPTLCGMNMVYTDKKRDSRLVVDENRRRLALVGGFNPDKFHIVKVEHGHTVWTVGEQQPLKFDALVTNRRDVTLAAAGADCIPLIFSDPVAMAIGVAHAGWKGTVERVAECVVRAMEAKFGCRPENLRVAMGPGVRQGCYRMPLSDERSFTDIHPDCVAYTPPSPVDHRLGKKGLYTDKVHSHGKDVPDLCLLKSQRNSEGDLSRAHENGHDFPPLSTPTKSSEFKVLEIPTEQLKPKVPRAQSKSDIEWIFPDLQLANYHVLLHAGIKAEHIDMSTSYCTKCNPDLFFSYERDGFPFGNQIGFICMPSEQSG